MNAPAYAAPPAAEIIDAQVHYTRRGWPGRTATVRAVDGVSLSIMPARTLGLVGESGSGKSTAARVLLRLLEPTSGRVLLNGHDVTAVHGRELRALRRQTQMVFQDPYSSFDPLASLADSLSEALRGRAERGAERLAAAAELMAQVGLSPSLLSRHPRELSGGQLQRAAIARALAAAPSLVALDEPVSSLDVSTQAQIVSLLHSLQAQTGLAYLFISHDLSVVRRLSHDVAVLYLGRVVESGPVSAVYERPRHPYTAALLSAVPIPDPARQRSRPRIVLQGDIPSPSNPPSGCRFRTRCPWAMPVCAQTDPPATTTEDGVTTYCHLHSDGPRLAGESVLTLGDRPDTTA
ncbi:MULTISPECIES: ABC transporter ATP-binding protein [unclassified Pseudofrankia]|uniref:oligopeptide/dipeptide ABC transporter ATP-binding protein n=1 Tax=unclassified Pseudofrankia TaxID=2994372 RepID=UPI0008D8F3E9|nr:MULTISPECIES: ABC transporter ATP-binding protein [unclassified Pseudofrankia]MDT3439287.1 ABC transporter ATP-binding protein [Pseudofrankia sp. BMG5.37]OHV73969.1 hypothetical protein BCD48_32730 [Pseudofrankia sp. BMG5.36]